MRSTRMKSSIYIPEEILTNILLRLPVKSLNRFKCVCKSWSNLIGSSSFIGRHLGRNVTNHSHTFLIAAHNSGGMLKISHSLFSFETWEECLEIDHPLWKENAVWIHGSSNGLVCLSKVPECNSLIICNPSIKEHVELSKPNTNINLPSQYFCRIALAFGFHPGINDYKVVRIVKLYGVPNEDNLTQVEVYSLSTNSWNRVGAIPPSIKSMRLLNGHAIFNGVAYWVMLKVEAENYSYYLVAFDTSSEIFEEFLIAQAAANIKPDFTITMYKESICLLQSNPRRRRLQRESVDIWVLQEKSFTMLHTVAFPGIRDLVPLGFRKDNELLIYQKTDEGRYDLVLYNLESKEVNNTGIVLWKDFYHHKDTSHIYVESLVALKDQRTQSKNRK